MKKEVLLVIGIFFLVSAGVLAQEVGISSEVEEYIKDFVEKGGIEKDKIKDVVEVDKNDLPNDLNIQDIGKNNIGIYEINYTEGDEVKKIFVVTYATSEFKKKSVSVIRNIQNIYFTYSGVSSEDDFLTASGVSLDNKGYVMLRSGSITGISTNLDISGNGRIFIKVYKNNVDTGFENLISSNDLKSLDYDLQSEKVVKYYPGDVISVYVTIEGEANWGEVVTIVETTS